MWDDVQYMQPNMAEIVAWDNVQYMQPNMPEIVARIKAQHCYIDFSK
jgi:hypothetical protein